MLGILSVLEVSHGVPMITLFSYDTPNGRKISVALEAMQVDYRIEVVDISKGDQHKPDFVKISPANKIPAISDSEGPGGNPITIFESGAILLYLGQKTGLFWPDDAREQVQVLEWLMFQVGGFGPMLGQAHHFGSLPEGADRKYGLQRYMAEAQRLYTILDLRLQNRPYLTDHLSIADFALLGWAWRHERHRVALARFPNVKRWYDALMVRDDVARGFSVPMR